MDESRGWRYRKSTQLLAVIALLMVTSCAPEPAVNAAPPSSPGSCPNTAAALHDWGTPNRQDNFDDPSLEGWHVYDGPGHAGNGRRTPDAISVADGVLSITGDARGRSGGMGWDSGQKFGRWEACVKSPPSAPGYHSVVLLWPDAEDWPVGGEIDFMEAIQPSRQVVEGWLHYGQDDRRDGGGVAIDASQWHAWAVEWTPRDVSMYVDGVQWWTTTNTATFPPRSLHLCLQVDDFGGDIAAGGHQLVDWVRQYSPP